MKWDRSSESTIKKHKRFLPNFLCFLSSLCLGLVPTIHEARQSHETGKLPAKIRRIERGLIPLVLIKGRPVIKMNLVDRMRHYKVPGVSVAVINNYRIEWARGYGIVEAGKSKPVTTETLFQAGSISKPIAAMVTLRMVQEGKLSLDEDVNRKLVSWKVPENEFTKEQKVTLRRLLSHSSGMTNSGVGEYSCDEQIPTLLDALEGKPPSKNPPTKVDFIPGSRWRYSGGGYAVLQQLLVDITGKPFPESVDETVFQRLMMRHSTFQEPLPDNLSSLAATGHQTTGEKYKCRFIYPEKAAAALWSTPSDLARFVIEVQRSYNRKSNRLLSAEMTRLMLTTQIENTGLGVFIAGKGRATRFSHGGGNQGFFSYLIGYPETGQGAVVMVNGTDYWDLVHEVVRGIALEYGWPDYIQERAPAKISPAVYEKLAGRYEVTPDFILTLATENERLFLKDSMTELIPESETRFFLMDGRLVTFTKDERGEINGLVLKQNDFIIRAKRLM